MDLFDFALSELERVEKKCETVDSLKMQHEVTRGILRVVRAFQKGNHSGSTAHYAINIIERVLRFKPITALTGEDNEWGEPYKTNAGVQQQNKRCSAVFRDNQDNATAEYIDGKLFSNDDGASWFSSNESRISITFPFVVPLYPQYIMIKKEEETNELADTERSDS